MIYLYCFTRIDYYFYARRRVKYNQLTEFGHDNIRVLPKDRKVGLCGRLPPSPEDNFIFKLSKLCEPILFQTVDMVYNFQANVEKDMMRILKIKECKRCQRLVLTTSLIQYPRKFTQLARHDRSR